MEKLLQQLKNLSNDYKPAPFWSWNNKIEVEELIKQIHYMYDSGMGGFFIHARTGLKTPYMSEEWFTKIDAVIAEAEKLNMNVWLYDENGWPSGFVGGELLENDEYLCRYLVQEKTNFYDDNALCVYIKVNGKMEKAQKNTDCCEFYCVYDRKEESYTDILNPIVVDKFIELTHEKYYQRYKKYFGNVIKGFFTDEPQYSRTDMPYSPILADEFQLEYGENLNDGLINLFLNDEESFDFRTKYYKLINKVFTKNYIKKIYDWCNCHSCQITGHAIDETTFAGQMMCCAGVMPFYEFEHIPGIDWLGRQIDSDIAPKQLCSVACQLGKKYILTESFAMCGWDVSPIELKWIADFQYHSGVNFMCHHLLSYSLFGQGKKDHPPSFGRHMPWREGFITLNEYFTRYGYINSNTREKVDCLLLNTISSAYLDCDKNGDGELVREMDMKFKETTKKLSLSQIYHHYTDESFLSRATVKNGKLIIGQCEYSYFIFPESLNLFSSSLKILKEFINNGGKVYFDGHKPKYLDGKSYDFSEINSNCTFEELEKNAFVKVDEEIYSTIRTGEIGEFLVLSNRDKVEKNCKIEVKANGLIKLDLSKLETSEVKFIKSGEFIKFEYNFDKMETVMFVLGNFYSSKEEINHTNKIDITNNFKLAPSQKNIFTLDKACYSFDEKNYSKKMPMYAILEKLIKKEYNGKLFIKHTFNVKKKVKAYILMEKNKVRATLNGNELKFIESDFDVLAVKSDISNFIKEGENEFIYELNFYNSPLVKKILYDANVKESLKNCLSFDTELESSYIYGDFDVSGQDFKEEENNALVCEDNFELLSTRNEKVLPLVQNGYPFFCGNIVYLGKIENDGSAVSLMLDGHFMTAKVTINGMSKIAVFDNKIDIQGMLKLGSNDVRIEIAISLRNALGPHHLGVAEPYFVAPSSFTMTGGWNEEINPNYKDRYAFVNQGLIKITLIKHYV